jgi:hypothetical protein
MDPVQALLNLKADIERIASEVEREKWQIVPKVLNSTLFYVTMTSDIDQESYSLSLECSDYPDEAPSIKCINLESMDSNDPNAWPSCDGFRPPPAADLCLNISREGLKLTHPNWQNDTRIAWDPSGNPIWRVLAALQDRINDKVKYHGRNK